MKFIREVVIDPSIDLVAIKFLAAAGNVIIGNRAGVRIGHWEELQNISDSVRNWNDIDLTAGRNCLALASVRIARGRVKYHAGLSGRKPAFSRRHKLRGGASGCRGTAIGANEVPQKSGQIAAALGCDWHGRDYGSSAASARALVVGKKEQLVFSDRAAKRAPELIPA